jgi:hypothetical protein
VFSAISVMAQKSINLNRVSIQNYQELSLTENNSAGINEAKRFRELDLNPKIQNTELIRMNDTLLLDLFNEKQYKACIDKIGVDKNGTISIRARLLDYNYGYCLISTFNSKSAIIIEVPEKNEFYKVKFDQQTSKYYL